jgi:hypothetical protein
MYTSPIMSVSTMHICNVRERQNVCPCSYVCAHAHLSPLKSLAHDLCGHVSMCTYMHTCVSGYTHAAHILSKEIHSSTTQEGHTQTCMHTHTHMKGGQEGTCAHMHTHTQAGIHRCIQAHVNLHACVHAETSEGHMRIHTGQETFKHT